MSKSTELDKTVKRYLLDHINGSGYDVDLSTDAQRIKFLFDTFYSEQGDYSVPRLGLVRALAEYYAGLPSCCDIEFANYDITKLAYQWGQLPPAYTMTAAQIENAEAVIVGNWFNLLANKTAQLFRQYNLNY